MAFTGSVQQSLAPENNQPLDPNQLAPQTQQEQPKPSFREAVAASQQQQEQRFNELATSAGAQPPATAAPQQQGISQAQQQSLEGAIAEMTPEQFDAWYKAQPQGALKIAAKNIADFIGTQMRQQFGDLLQLGDMANADPKVKKKLERLVKDPNAREFILNKAFEIFDPAEFAQPAQPPQGQYSTPAALTQEQVADTVRNTLDQERQRIAYEADRSREVEALVREVPSLNWQQHGDKAARKVSHIIEIAEKRTAQSGQRVSYRDIASELDMIGSATPPQPVPQTSTTQTPPAQNAQAPRSEIEARQNMTRLLEQHGGLMGLAAALPRRG